MAEGFAKHMLKNEQYLIKSAGVSPEPLNSFAVEVMDELGVDITNHYSKNIEKIDLSAFDIVVTVCDNAKTNCPIVKHKKVIHYSFQDPSISTGTTRQKLTIYRKVRDQINKMTKFILTNYDVLCQELN
jgi:arsenate reductase|tara:strand:+ start:92 stop:478 length:387 start_codon:yes stop_codon:yes gene_type:complete